MNEKCVTILMPAFNAEKYIEESIKSVINQTHKEWKLFILDDGSEDSTGFISKKYSQIDNRIYYIKLNHSGLCNTLNYGLSITETKYIARIDSDDIWLSNKLEKQINFLLKNPQIKVLGTLGFRINNKGKIISKMDTGPLSLYEFEKLRGLEPISLIHSSIVAEKVILINFGGYRIEDYPAEDLYLWNRIAVYYPILVLDERLVLYRISNEGVSSTKFFKQLIQLERLRHILKSKENINYEEFLNYLMKNKYKYLKFFIKYIRKMSFRKGAGYYFNGNKFKGIIFLLISFIINPIKNINRIVSRK